MRSPEHQAPPASAPSPAVTRPAPRVTAAPALVQRHAVVRAISEDGILVDDGQARLVRQATSCLIEPLVGDLVLIVAPIDDPGGHLLAVLERDSATATTLSVRGDLELAAPSGRVRLRGGEGVELSTPATLDLRADEARLQARVGRIFMQECAAVVRSMFASMSKLTHVGHVLELLVDRVLQRSEHSTRVIAGTDQTQAQDIALDANRHVQVHSQRTVIDGREVVKLDGGQIHLG